MQQFPKQSKSEWLAKVEKDLKGKAIDSLDWSLHDTSYTPFFHSSDGIPASNVNDQKSNQWQICQRLIVTDETIAQAIALDILNKGANALRLELQTEDIDFNTLFKDINLAWIHTSFLRVDKEPISMDFIRAFAQYVEPTQENSSIACSFDGELNDEELEEATGLLPNGKFILLDNRSESTPNELTNLLHQWTALFEAGYEPTDISIVTTNVGHNYFDNIAKLRAMRLLWSHLSEAYGSPTECPSLEVLLDEHILTSDEHTNKIASGIAAMAATIGGADRLCIYPSDETSHAGGDTFSNRIALNINHILQMESYLDNVVDPSAGSYFIEKLTNDIAEKAWETYKEELD